MDNKIGYITSELHLTTTHTSFNLDLTAKA